MTDPNPTPDPTSNPNPEPTTDQTFTQADLDRIVSERLQRERAKFADYDDLKAKAAGLTPSQAKRLVGSTREELEADADELLKDIGAQKKSNNVSPREGNQPQSGGSDDMREFTRGLFSRAQQD